MFTCWSVRSSVHGRVNFHGKNQVCEVTLPLAMESAEVAEARRWSGLIFDDLTELSRINIPPYSHYTVLIRFAMFATIYNVQLVALHMFQLLTLNVSWVFLEFTSTVSASLLWNSRGPGRKWNFRSGTRGWTGAVQNSACWIDGMRWRRCFLPPMRRRSECNPHLNKIFTCKCGLRCRRQ